MQLVTTKKKMKLKFFCNKIKMQKNMQMKIPSNFSSKENS